MNIANDLVRETRAAFIKLAEHAALGDVFNFNCKVMYLRGCAQLRRTNYEVEISEFEYLCYRNAISKGIAGLDLLKDEGKAALLIRQIWAYADHIGYDIKDEYASLNLQ